jgi:hypothetical protein
MRPEYDVVLERVRQGSPGVPQILRNIVTMGGAPEERGLARRLMRQQLWLDIAQPVGGILAAPIALTGRRASMSTLQDYTAFYRRVRRVTAALARVQAAQGGHSDTDDHR